MLNDLTAFSYFVLLILVVGVFAFYAIQSDRKYMRHMKDPFDGDLTY